MTSAAESRRSPSKRSAGRKPVVVGVSHESAIQAVALARHAASDRGDGRARHRALLRPAAAVRDPQPLREHRRGRACPSSSTTRRRAWATAFRRPTSRRSQKFPASSASSRPHPMCSSWLSCSRRWTPRSCLVLGGAENTIWPALAVGAVGNTATAASAAPQVFARFWELANRGAARRRPRPLPPTDAPSAGPTPLPAARRPWSND